MDLYMFYDWITSLLRPRAHYKTVESKKQQVQRAQHVTTSSANNNNCVDPQQKQHQQQQLEYVETTINDIEIIPTLEFVSNTTNPETFEYLQHCAATCVREGHQHVACDSRQTFVIERTSSSSSASIIESGDLLRQEVSDFSLRDEATFSSFVDEPTSSISIEMMENTEKTTGTATTTTTTTPSGADTAATSRSSGVPATSLATTRNSPGNVPTTTTTTTPTTPPSSGAEQSVEEEIEEAIEISEEIEEGANSSGAASASASASAKVTNTLFGIDFTSESDQDLSGGQSLSKKSSTDDDQFKIDEDQLSGGQLAQHFVLEDDDDDDNDNHNDVEDQDQGEEDEPLEVDDVQGSLSGEEPIIHSPHDSSGPAVVEGQHRSSTADDISKLGDEAEQVELPATSTGESLDESQKKRLQSTSNIEAGQSTADRSDEEMCCKSMTDKERDHLRYPSKQRVIMPELLSGASSIHSEKDHSIEEMVESNQSIEMICDEKSPDLTSAGADLDIHNETLLDDLLPMSQQKSRSIENLVNIESAMHIEQVETCGDFVASTSQSQMITDLDESTHDDDNKVQKTSLQTLESSEKSSNEPFQSVTIIKQTPAEVSTRGDTESSRVVDESTVLDLKTSNKTNIDVQEAQENLTAHTNASETAAGDNDGDDDDDAFLELMKLHILTMKDQNKKQFSSALSSPEVSSSGPEVASVKQMERVSLSEFGKEVLEDITEESERNSLTIAEEQNSLTLERSVVTVTKSDSKMVHVADEEIASTVVGSNVIQTLEQKVEELRQMLASKDACLASLNLQLMNTQRRESNGANSTEQPASARDTSSQFTNSTEYRTLQEDFGGPTMDIYVELAKRDELIAKLTESLQQSLTVRENLQAETEKLSTELQMLRKQLAEAMDTMRRPYWPRDQESNGGQRISEISMDLISESDDDLDRQFLTDNEDKFSRNSRERQLSVPLSQLDCTSGDLDAMADSAQAAMPFSKQIEQFQKYLTPSEVRLFFMVQKKFDDYLCQELEKCKMKYEHEAKILTDQCESEKRERDMEIRRLLSLREENETKHTQEMEDLRKYFETKCADLEKQFSDDVFSQKSQHLDIESSTSSECSDQEQLSGDNMKTSPSRSKDASPRKRLRTALLLSPSHRQMTPSSDAFGGDQKDINRELTFEITELKTFYQNKIHEIQRVHEENMRKINDRLKYYESRYPEDDFVLSTANANNETATTHDSTAASEDVTQASVQTVQAQAQVQTQAQAQPQAQAQAQSQSEVEVQAEVHAHDSFEQDSANNNNNNKNNNNNTSLIIIDQDELNMNNEGQVVEKIIEEYERRLQEQLTLAREDIVHELEQQIQTLLSETTSDDQHWPKELILLREKFTAKSQLEIAQLQIKHAEEMSRLKKDYEKQLNRKNKRHLTFDAVRDFDKLINERDSLRELSKTFRHVLSELAKCVANCESDLNESLAEEMHRLLTCNRTLDEHDADLPLNSSVLNTTLYNTTRQLRVCPDVHGLLEVVEDPSLLQFISNKGSEFAEDFDLKECLERLRSEASYLLHLSEDLMKRRHQDQQCSESDSSGMEKNDSCCEGEGDLKLQTRKVLRVNSLNEQQLPTYQASQYFHSEILTSLPPDLNRLHLKGAGEGFSTPGGDTSVLSFQVVELKNRLIKSESDRQKLQQELDHTISRNAELGQELQVLRDQLSQLNSLNHTDYAEGYGLSSLKSQQRYSNAERVSASFAQLQEKARHILSTPAQKQQNNDATVVLLQMIEDFCRECDKVVECNKKDREDLQSQIDTADKQLKATRQFLEEQAAEREQERDEFLREIDRLKEQLRDKEKERSTYANASEEVEQLEVQIRELTQNLQESNSKRDKFEVELKASIDKIFVLREIISDLETQVETKALNEHVLGEKAKQLEEFINSQTRSNESLQSVVQSLKTEIERSYQSRINSLEEKLQNIRPTAEQSMVLDQVLEQLRDVENTLEQKTKALEALHHTVSANSCSISATEDVSVHGGSQPGALPATAIVTPPQGSPVHPSPRQHSLTMESVQRIVDKLSKHSRVEEAAIKRIRDLEMQIQQMRDAFVELQHERASLQERMSEQTQRISALQSRLEEQRQRAEELQRAGTSDLNIRIHDLQNEVRNLRETLSARDKQITTFKAQLEKSKAAIDRLEAELAVERQPDRSVVERLETELKQKCAENQKLKDKIRNEMINKLALPDLMETMLADKNEEIDHLREQLESKEKELQCALDVSQASSMAGAKGGSQKVDEVSTKLSARTLSDIVSITEFDEPDVVRRAVANNHTSPLSLPEVGGGLQQTMETSKDALANLTHRRTEDLSGFATLQPVNTFEHPHYFQGQHVLLGSGQSGATATPPMVPRQINFSALTEDSKLKTPVLCATPDNKVSARADETIRKLESEVQQLKSDLERVQSEKERVREQKEKNAEDLIAAQGRLGGLQDNLAACQQELYELRKERDHNRKLQEEVTEKTLEIEQLKREQDRLQKENVELLTKSEKDRLNYVESEANYVQRIKDMEEKILRNTEREVGERESLRKELQCLSETHQQCKYTAQEAEVRKREIEQLNREMKAKDERLLTLSTKLSIAEDTVKEVQQQMGGLERELEKLRQHNSDNSSRQFSVDEIAQQVEKELNYSAQLDSNILRAIESEEENNLDAGHLAKAIPQRKDSTEALLANTDDENFTGERELLNQLEALKAQIAVEREQNEAMRQELLTEKQHSQEIQEQDVVIIEAMRKRLEAVLDQEDDLHKQLEIEKERCERLQTQLIALQRSESRRNSSLLKSPTESPRKSPRSSNDFESELAERLRSEIKLLTAQNERERERSADIQRNSERERSRFERELQERIDYSEKLKREMEKVAREKESAEIELEHLQERLTLQTQEIESLEARIATLQEAETRRSTRRERQHKENAQLVAEVQELKTQLRAMDDERESLSKTVTQLRYDVERSAQRESKLAEALAGANAKLADREVAEATGSMNSSVPEQFLQKMKEINALLAENTRENKQMAETVQFLVNERRQLQRRCEELETQLSGSANIAELEERCNHLLGRYLRVESHRKALVYQKRYLKISLQSYQESEQRALAAMNGGHLSPIPRPKRKLFKTVALAIIAIQRMKYIGRIWHTGKRIVSKSVFTITQQKRSQVPTINCATTSSTSPATTPSTTPPIVTNGPQMKALERPLAPLKTPTLLSGHNSPSATVFDWSRVPTTKLQH